MKNYKYVICKSCSWVHFAVSKEYVEQWKKQWQELFDTKPKDWLAMYGITDKPPSAEETYYKCFLCRSPYTNFRKALKKEMPYGSTIQPILDFDEENKDAPIQKRPK